ncbi:hypothetical protein OIU76_006927 [Salix suchowensis]|nr:hypothetical protein OIU76_006927 [Salix suchowensis]
MELVSLSLHPQPPPLPAPLPITAPDSRFAAAAISDHQRRPLHHRTLVITKATLSTSTNNADTTLTITTIPATVNASCNPRVQGERSDIFKGQEVIGDTGAQIP